MNKQHLKGSLRSSACGGALCERSHLCRGQGRRGADSWLSSFQKWEVTVGQQGGGQNRQQREWGRCPKKEMWWDGRRRRRKERWGGNQGSVAPGGFGLTSCCGDLTDAVVFGRESHDCLALNNIAEFVGDLLSANVCCGHLKCSLLLTVSLRKFILMRSTKCWFEPCKDGSTSWNGSRGPGLVKWWTCKDELARSWMRVALRLKRRRASVINSPATADPERSGRLYTRGAGVKGQAVSAEAAWSQLQPGEAGGTWRQHWETTITRIVLPPHFSWLLNLKTFVKCAAQKELELSPRYDKGLETSWTVRLHSSQKYLHISTYWSGCLSSSASLYSLQRDQIRTWCRLCAISCVNVY